MTLKQEILLNGFTDLLRNRYASFFTVLRENNLTIEDPQNKHAQWPELGDEVQESNDDNQIETDNGSKDGSSNVSLIESDPVTTVVHLAHASIGEFFRTNTPTIIADVGIDIHEAKSRFSGHASACGVRKIFGRHGNVALLMLGRIGQNISEKLTSPLSLPKISLLLGSR